MITAWNKFWGAMTALSLLAVVGLVGYMFGRLPFQAKTLEEYELNCLAKGMFLDGTYVGDISTASRLEIARTILRRAKYESSEICPIVEGAIHLLAPTEERWGQSIVGLPFRSDTLAFAFTEQQRLANLKVLKDNGITRDVVPDGCAITVVRAGSSGFWSAQTPKARGAVAKGLVSIGEVSDKDGKKGKAVFFCLPQDAPKK